MTEQEFDSALLTWGADLSNWPDELRSSAEALLQKSETARSLQEEMIRMDAVLESAVMSDVQAGVVSAKVQQVIAQREQGREITDLIPIKQIVGWGSLAGIGGGILAAFAPVSVGVTSLLSVALGGALP